jgi:hypothetical protein
MVLYEQARLFDANWRVDSDVAILEACHDLWSKCFAPCLRRLVGQLDWRARERPPFGSIRRPLFTPELSRWL